MTDSINEENTMSTTPKPRYRFCWWCSRQLRGRHHLILRATSALANTEPVIVHHGCADEMLHEGGWDRAPANDNHVTTA
jgi:hypothetical protein